MAREIINPDDLADASERSYTQAIVENRTLYMSGQVGWDEEFVVVGSDIESQTEKAFENIGVVLGEVDKDLTDIAKITSYVVDLSENGNRFRTVLGQFFDEPYPCHTLIGVDQLADEELLVEIDVEVPLEL